MGIGCVFPNWEAGQLPQEKRLRPGAGACDQSQIPGLLPAARTHAKPTLRVAAAGIQAVGAEVVAALVAAQQALAAGALFAVVAEGNFASLDQMQLAPVDERRLTGEIQRNHGKSIETWKLLCVAST
jgi:hypothetical protein